MRQLSAVLAGLMLFQSCAALGPRSMGASASANSSANSGNSSANSSGNSGNSSANSSGGSNNSSANSNNSSANSSANSGNSTGQSNNSSASSNNTSYHSNNSSQNSRNSSNSNQSSRDSSNNTTDDPRVQNFSIALAGSALLVTTGVAVGLILYFALRKPPQPQKLEEEAKPAQAWLRANRRQLQADLALGAGPALEDLASAAEIRLEHFPHFCGLLAAHRAELLEPLRGVDDVSLETAVQVMSRVGQLTIADPVLKADADAFLAKHPEG